MNLLSHELRKQKGQLKPKFNYRFINKTVSLKSIKHQLTVTSTLKKLGGYLWINKKVYGNDILTKIQVF